MPDNLPLASAREHGRKRWVRPQSFQAAAAAVYAGVSPEARTALGSKWRADLRRWKSSPDSAPPLARVLEQVHTITQAGDDGFADVVCAAIHSAATTDPTQTTLPLPLDGVYVDAQRADVTEELLETEARARGFEDARTMLAWADGLSREALAGLRCSGAIRKRFAK